MENEIIKEIFLENLPTKQGLGTHINKRIIDWENSIGYYVNGIYDDLEFEVEIIKYDAETQYLWIKYLDKKHYKINPNNFKRCQLGKLLGKITGEFKIEIDTTFKDDNRDITIIAREYKDNPHNQGTNLKYYKYKCNKCGFNCGEHYKDGKFKEEYWTEESGLLRGNGCPCCNLASKIVVPNINSIVSDEETYWMIPYFQGGYDEAKLYAPQSSKNINFKCPDCYRIKDKEMAISTLYRTRSISCSCGDGLSYGHKYVYNLLEQIGLNFLSNHTCDWCRFYNKYKNTNVTGEYDFIIEDMKLIVEVDGGWHRKDNKMSGQKKEESVFLDKEKNRLAEENGYDIIRIIYNDDFKMKSSILKSKIVNYFDLSIIDWNKCEEFALSNLVKKVCEIKRDNPSMTTGNISKILGFQGQTVRKYLIKGSEIWDWINYEAKKEKLKCGSKNGKIGCKKVEIFKNNISLGVFESGTGLERQSEKLFGIKLNHSNISAVCSNKVKTHHGYTFKYIL